MTIKDNAKTASIKIMFVCSNVQQLDTSLDLLANNVLLIAILVRQRRIVPRVRKTFTSSILMMIKIKNH